MKVNFYIPFQEASNLVSGFGIFLKENSNNYHIFVLLRSVFIEKYLICCNGDSALKRSCCAMRQIGFGCMPCM